MTLTVTAIKPSENKSDKTGMLTLKPTSVNVNGQSYPLSAKIDSVGTHLEGRKTNAGDIAKPAAGVAIGAVVGRVLGGSTKGAVIGGVLGGAVGAQRAVETKDRDVVLPSGTTVVLILDQPFKTRSLKDGEREMKEVSGNSPQTERPSYFQPRRVFSLPYSPAHLSRLLPAHAFAFNTPLLRLPVSNRSRLASPVESG